MRWHPPAATPVRVIVWRLERIGTDRKAVWYWTAKARNGKTLAVSVEYFSSRLAVAKAAVMFGGPRKLLDNVISVTASHDGQVLPLNWVNA